MYSNRVCLKLMSEKWHGPCRNTLTGSYYSSRSRSFDEIPGPRSLPVIGTLYKYLPYIGEYNMNKFHETGAKRLERYGSLVKERIVPGVNIVWVFRPEDIEQIFRSEVGLHPERRSHLALLKYRTDRPHIYNTGGLLPTNGPEWWRIRKEFQKDLSKPRNIINYIEDIDAVVEKFVQLCSQRNHTDLLPLLSRLFLELTCLVAFDVSMDSFSPKEMEENSRSSKLIDAAFISNSVIWRLDNGPQLWKYFPTPLYKKLCTSQKFMEDIAVEMVNRKMNEMERGEVSEKESLLQLYLNNRNLDVKDVVGMATDILLAGIDTTTYSIAFALYHLSNSDDAQKKMKQEADTLLPNPSDPITPDILRNAFFTKAVIKETFRLNPISVGVGRVLKSDSVLSGYHIPSGTVVVTQNQVTCRLPEYFPNPNCFVPERWLRDNNTNSDSKNVHPYLVLPFGHGPRSCIARRLAEQNMQMLLLRISRKYHLKWRGGKLDSVSLLINKPDSPIDIEFLQR